MLRKISLAFVLLMTTRSAAETDCSMYFIEKHIFTSQNYKIQNTFQVMSPLKDTPNGTLVYKEPILDVTPMQAYTMQIEAKTLLRNLQRNGLKALERYKDLSENSGWISSSDTQISFQVRLENLISELVETSKLATNKATIEDYLQKSQEQLRLLEEFILQARELAYKLDTITIEANNLPLRVSRGFHNFRFGNIRMIMTYQRLHPYFQAHIDNAERLINGTPLKDSKIESRYLEIHPSHAASLPNPQQIRDFPTNRDPRQDKYSRSWESRYGTPHRETVLHPKHPDAERARLSRDVYFPIMTSTGKSDTIRGELLFRIQLLARPSKVIGQHAYKILLDDMRTWAAQEKLTDQIHFAQSGLAKDPLLVTITNKGSRETFEKFKAAFSKELGSVEEIKTKTVSYHNIELSKELYVSPQDQVKDFSNRLEAWLSRNRLAQSEVRVSVTPGSQNLILQVTIDSDRTDQILQRLQEDFKRDIYKLSKTQRN